MMNAIIDTPEYFATRINNALKGFGTKIEMEQVI